MIIFSIRITDCVSQRCVSSNTCMYVSLNHGISARSSQGSFNAATCCCLTCTVQVRSHRMHFRKGVIYRLCSETARSQWYLSVCMVSAGSSTSYIISRLPVNLKICIIHNTSLTKSYSVHTAFELPPGNWALSVVSEASFVYIVWLIACKEHNELLIPCASNPAATVCTVNVIRDSASCPWWAHLLRSHSHSTYPRMESSVIRVCERDICMQIY